MKTKQEKINVPLLRKIQKAIRLEPRRLRMNDWIVKHYDGAHQDHPSEIPPCNTSACIAGHAVIVAKNDNPEWFARVGRKLRNSRDFDVEDEAIKLLHLSRDQAVSLFYADEWPQKFQEQYANANTAQERGKAAIARIEQFIKDNQ